MVGVGDTMFFERYDDLGLTQWLSTVRLRPVVRCSRASHVRGKGIELQLHKGKERSSLSLPPGPFVQEPPQYVMPQRRDIELVLLYRLRAVYSEIKHSIFIALSWTTQSCPTRLCRQYFQLVFAQ